MSAASFGQPLRQHFGSTKRYYYGDKGYARHGWECQPGKYAVFATLGVEFMDFIGYRRTVAEAVVDDFGNLVRVK